MAILDEDLGTQEVELDEEGIRVIEIPDVEAEVKPEPIDPEVKKNLDITQDRLLILFNKYRNWRERNRERVWNEIYDAYNGVKMFDNFPYASDYIIREIFREIETLKPQIADQILPDEFAFEFKAKSEGEIDDAMAATDIVKYHLETMDLMQEVRKWLDESILWGNSYLQFGWNRYRDVQRKIDKFHSPEDGDFWERTTEEIEKEGPYLRHLSHWKVYTDPFTEKLEDSPCVFVRDVVTGAQLKTKVREGDYDLDAIKRVITGGGGRRRNSTERGNLGPYGLRIDHEFELSEIDDIGEFEVLTCWANNGWVYTIVEEEIVRAQENPFLEVPILTLRNYPQIDEHYGKSEVEIIMEDQRLLNDMASMWVDSIHLTLNPMWLVDSAEKKNWNITSFKPGGVAYVDNMEGIQPLATNPKNFELDAAMSAIRRNMQLATGVTDELTGSSRQRTATGIARLQDAAGVRIQHKVRIFTPIVKKLYRTLYELESRFLEQEVSVRIQGRDGSTAFQRYGPERFMPDVDVQVKVAPNLSTPLERQNKWVSLWQIISQDPRFEFEPIAIELLRAFEVADPRRSIANPNHSQQDAMNEVQNFMATGVYPIVRVNDDHMTHIQAMQLIENSVEFTQMDPVLVANHQAHKQEHASYLQQQQLQAQQSAQTGLSPEASPGEADLRTEAQFGNAVTGAAQQGAL